MQRFSTRRAGTVLALFMLSVVVRADNTAQTLPFSQDWANAGLITANDSWSGVPGIIGYRGDGLTATTGANPQTITLPAIDPGDTPAGVVDVNANQANPNTFTTGGVTEFAIANPVVALSGSGTASAPFVLLHLDTSGQSGIQVSYDLRDIDGSTDNAVQPVALQYRIGSERELHQRPRRLRRRRDDRSQPGDARDAGAGDVAGRVRQPGSRAGADHHDERRGKRRVGRHRRHLRRHRLLRRGNDDAVDRRRERRGGRRRDDGVHASPSACRRPRRRAA